MEMEHRLAGDSAVVCEKIEALQLEGLDNCARYGVYRLHDAAQFIRFHLQKVAMMALRDDKRVAVMDRVDIQNGERTIVFVQNLGRYFSLYYIAENAGHVA